MSDKQKFFSPLWRITYFVFAHLPTRIIANIILYLAIVSLLLHFASFYIEEHPQEVEKFIEKNLLIEIKFSSIKVHYNLLSPSLKFYNLTIFQSTDKNQRHINKDLHFNSASIAFNLLKSVLFLKADIKYINLDGFKTSITRSKNNNIAIGSLNLLHSSQENNFILPLWLIHLKSFSLTNTQLIINDEITGIKNYKLENIHIKFTNKNEWLHSLSLSITNHDVDSGSSPILFDQIIFTSLLKGSSYKLKEWTGKWFIDIKNLHYKNQDSLSAYIKNSLDIHIIKGIFSGQLWGSISQSSISEIIGQIQLNEFELQKITHNKTLKIKQLTTLFKLNENKHFLQSSQQQKVHIKNWLVSLYQLKITSPIHTSRKSSIIVPYTHLNILKKSALLEIKSNIHKLPLSGLDDTLAFFNNELSQAYQQIQPTGSLSQFSGSFTIESEQIKNIKISTKLNNISVHAWQQLPQFKNLSATLWINNQTGVINIDSSDFRLNLQPIFRHKWQFDHLSSQISWQPVGSQLWINADNSKINNNHLNISGNFQLWVDKKNKNATPLMLINAYFDHVDASFVPLYIPAHAFSQGLTDWLDHAFISAFVPDGGILFRGRLGQFPYANHQGAMEITFHAQDMLLNYYNGWPKFEKVKSIIQFTETGLFVDVENAQLYDSYTHNTRLELKNYLSSNVIIHSKIKTNATDAFQFLQQSKILNQNYIKKLTSKGQVNIDLSLEIPTDERSIKSLAKVNFNKLLFSPEWLEPLSIEKINGAITINNGKLSSQLLSGKLLGDPLNNEPIQVKINTLKSKQVDNEYDDITQVKINGIISTESLRASTYIPESLHYLFSYIQGKAPYKAKLLLSYHNGQLIPDLQIQSNLKGIESLLPEPLNKDSKEEKIFNLTYKENSKNKSLQLTYSDILVFCNQSSINQPSLTKTHINFFGNSCLLPIKPVISITGKMDLSNYSQWQSVISNKEKTNNFSLYHPAIEFDLQEMILPSDFLESSTNQESSTDKKSLTDEEPGTDFSPSFLSINGSIENLMIDKTSLGKLSIVSHNKFDQLVYDKISLYGKQIQLLLQGNTETNITNPMTQIKGSINIKDTGNLLKKLDYYHGLDKADSHFDGYLKWHGSLSSFSNKNLFGKIKYQLNDGNLTEVNPGIGKIIELINLNDIKQRFKFNLGFDNLSKPGLAFNSIEGNLLFNQNNLYTRDIKLDSNIAKINVNGYVDMDKKTCRHLLIVTPNISSGLPYAGMAIAGPAGAALGYLGQKILGKQFNKISQYEYNISGLCKDPIITNKILSTRPPPD